MRKKRLGFRAQTNVHVGTAMNSPIPSSSFSGRRPLVEEHSSASNEKEKELLYRRDLSIGGVILVAVGAKKLLLPALLSSQPALFAITASASVITGYRYIRQFWDAMTGDKELDALAFTGGTTTAMMLLGDGVTALALVSLVNLSEYLTLRTNRLTKEIIACDDEQLSAKSANVSIGESRLPKFLLGMSFVLSGVAFVHNFWGVRQQLLFLLAKSDQLIVFLQTNAMGAPLFTLVYTIAPLILLPTTFLAITAGWLYGPVHGLLYAFVGSTTSAMLAYLIGRRFGEKIFSKEKNEDTFISQGTIQRFTQKMVERPFESVLMMELLYLPNDLISYLAGFLQLNWKPFLLATTLGSIPSNISFVWFGASIMGNPLTSTPTINLPTLAASGAIFVSSLTVSRYLSQKDEEIEEAAPDMPEASDASKGGDIELSPLGAV